MPSGFEPIEGIRPFASALTGVEAGQRFTANQQAQEGRQIGLDMLRGRQSALATYAETKDPTELLKYDPEMVMKLDDHRAKQMQAGIDLTVKAAPFLKQMAGDPRSWNAFADDMEKAGAPKSITTMFRTGDAQTRVRNLDALLKIGNDLQEDLYKRKSTIKLDAAKKHFEDVTMPGLKAKAGLDMDYLRETERLKEKYAAVTDKKTMPKTVFDDYTKMVHDVRQGWAKLRVEAEKDMLFSVPPPNPATGRTEAQVEAEKRALRDRMTQMETEDLNRVRDMYDEPAEEYKVKLPAKAELPKREVGGGRGTLLTPEQRAALIKQLKDAAGGR